MGGGTIHLEKSMIIDSQNTLSGTYAQATGVWTGQVVTTTAISTNVIDLGPVNSNTLRDIGTGSQPLYLMVLVPTLVTAAGAATVTFSLESDSTADLATLPVVHWTSTAIGKAALIAGYTVAVVTLPHGKTYKQYLGVRYTVATGPLTAGGFIAFIGHDPDAWVAYAKAYTIS